METVSDNETTNDGDNSTVGRFATDATRNVGSYRISREVFSAPTSPSSNVMQTPASSPSSLDAPPPPPQTATPGFMGSLKKKYDANSSLHLLLLLLLFLPMHSHCLQMQICERPEMGSEEEVLGKREESVGKRKKGVRWSASV